MESPRRSLRGPPDHHPYLDGIIRSDRWFTLPGVLLIVLFGVAGALVGQLPLLGTPWIRQAIILFTVSGLAFGFQVAPLQRQLLALARSAAAGGTWDEVRYRRLSRRWELWGLLAIVTPLAALAFQWFGLAPHMADLRWVPLTGATIIDKKAWLAIPEHFRPKVLEASKEAGKKLRGEIRRLNDEAVQVMVKNGLKVSHVPPDAQAEWRKMVEDVYPRIRGKIIPADMFDAARKYRDEYRAANRGRAVGDR